MVKVIPARLTLALGESEADFFTVYFVFFIDVLDKGLEFGPGFIGSSGSFFCLGHKSIITYNPQTGQTLTAALSDD